MAWELESSGSGEVGGEVGSDVKETVLKTGAEVLKTPEDTEEALPEAETTEASDDTGLLDTRTMVLATGTAVLEASDTTGEKELDTGNALREDS